MTDGILLAETQSDRTLAAYDTIIIDEAHERSLNIDFLLGYLKQLLPQRPDLKLIVTSATLDAERFARHFGADGEPAPVIEVSGRNYPVEVRYRPLGGGRPTRPTTRRSSRRRSSPRPRTCGAKVRATSWCSCRASARSARPSDLLREEPRAAAVRAHGGDPAAVCAAVGRAAAARVQPQRRAPHRARDQRRRDFADGPGHSLRDRLGTRAGQALFAAQQGDAAADREDRAGGRRSARRTLRPRRRRRLRAPVRRRGLRRAAEIHRAGNPALVAGRGHPAHGGARSGRRRRVSVSRAAEPARDRRRLPAAARSSARSIEQRKLTPLGRELAALPVDPRIGRMLLAAKDGPPGRDAGHRQRALGARSARASAGKAPGGRSGAPALSRRALGFPEPARALAILRRRAGGEAVARKLVEQCRAHFVSYLRLREWRDLHRQLAEQVAELGWRWTDTLPDKIDAARYEAIHRALLAGLLSNIGCRADADEHYLGTRGLKFFLHPGSGMAKKGAEMGARRRADRNDAAVRALRRERRAGVDRASRRDRCSSAAISIRSGMPRAAKSSPPSVSRCTD